MYSSEIKFYRIEMIHVANKKFVFPSKISFSFRLIEMFACAMAIITQFFRVAHL